MESIISIIFGGIVGMAFCLSILNYLRAKKTEEKLKSVESATKRHGYELYTARGYSEISKLSDRVSKLELDRYHSELVKSRLARKGQPDEFTWLEGLRVSNYQTKVKEIDKVNDSPEDKIKYLNAKIAKDLLELKKELTKVHAADKDNSLVSKHLCDFMNEVESEVRPDKDIKSEG